MGRRIRFRHVVIGLGIVASLATSDSWQRSATSPLGPLGITASAPTMAVHYTAHLQPVKSMWNELRIRVEATGIAAVSAPAYAFTVEIAPDMPISGVPPCPTASSYEGSNGTLEQCVPVDGAKDIGFSVIVTRNAGVDVSVSGKVTVVINGDGSDEPPPDAMISLTEGP